MKKNQKGFSFVEVMLVLIFITLIVFVGWYVMNSNKDKTTSKTSSSSSPQTKKTATDPYAGWKTYCDKQSIGCVKYPSDWSLNEGDANVQLTTPKEAANPINILYDLSVHGPASSDGNIVVDSLDLAIPINGLKAEEGIIKDANAPYISLVDPSGSWNHGTGATTWSLGASPNDLPYDNDTKANAWFTSAEAKTALQIIQSFSYKQH